jgi:hypothetical protein
LTGGAARSDNANFLRSVALEQFESHCGPIAVLNRTLATFCFQAAKFAKICCLQTAPWLHAASKPQKFAKICCLQTASWLHAASKPHLAYALVVTDRNPKILSPLGPKAKDIIDSRDLADHASPDATASEPVMS